MKNVLLLLCIFIVPFTISDVYADNETANNVASNSVSSNDPPKGEIMLTSATIISFTGFGSILAISFRGSSIRNQVICTLIIYGAVVSEIVLHLYVIMCIFDNSLLAVTYNQIIVATMFLVSIIVICFGIITVLQKGYEVSKTRTGHIAQTEIDKVISESEDKRPVKSYDSK